MAYDSSPSTLLLLTATPTAASFDPPPPLPSSTARIDVDLLSMFPTPVPPVRVPTHRTEGGGRVFFFWRCFIFFVWRITRSPPLVRTFLPEPWELTGISDDRYFVCHEKTVAGTAFVIAKFGLFLFGRRSRRSNRTDRNVREHATRNLSIYPRRNGRARRRFCSV